MSSSQRTCPTCRQLICHASYARHLKSHTNKFQCDQCPSLQFNRRDNLVRHMKIHEPQVTYDNQYANSLPLDVQPVRMPAPQPQPSDVHPFTADEKRLKRNLMTFKVDAPPITNKSKSAEFMHPFSCKVMGPRGSGKTSFTVSYIQKVACFRFSKIFIVTASPNQPL